MASQGKAEDLITVEQFYALVEDGQKADLIDGVIYMASPDTLTSDQLAGFISTSTRCALISLLAASKLPVAERPTAFSPAPSFSASFAVKSANVVYTSTRRGSPIA